MIILITYPIEKYVNLYPDDILHKFSQILNIDNDYFLNIILTPELLNELEINQKKELVEITKIILSVTNKNNGKLTLPILVYFDEIGNKNKFYNCEIIANRISKIIEYYEHTLKFKFENTENTQNNGPVFAYNAINQTSITDRPYLTGNSVNIDLYTKQSKDKTKMIDLETFGVRKEEEKKEDLFNNNIQDNNNTNMIVVDNNILAQSTSRPSPSYT